MEVKSGSGGVTRKIVYQRANDDRIMVKKYKVVMLWERDYKKKKKKKNAMGTLIRNENASFGGNLGKPNAILPYSNNPA